MSESKVELDVRLDCVSRHLPVLGKNYQSLRKNLRKLMGYHWMQLTGRALLKISGAVDRMNGRVIRVNHWVQGQLEPFQEQKRERKELEQQIALMEGEGNNPSLSQAS